MVPATLTSPESGQLHDKQSVWPRRSAGLSGHLKFLYIKITTEKGMTQVSTPEDIERESRRVIGALYGEVEEFRVNVAYQMPEKGPREAWDVQVNFMLNGLKYTVDLEIQEKDGQVTNARLIDTMTPL